MKGKSQKAAADKNKQKQATDEFYSKEEIKRLDKFHSETENKFDDDEIYELMLKYKDDDEAILNELKEQLKERKRGGDFEWQSIGKSNCKYFNFNMFFKI
jgi:hypothetical protein